MSIPKVHVGLGGITDVECEVIDEQPYLCEMRNIFTKEECKKLITIAEDIGWHEPHTGGVYMRSIMVSEDLADTLTERIWKHLPKEYERRELLYINDHFRFSKYNTGGHFKVHQDGNNLDNKYKEKYGYSTISYFTINIFLNDDFEGGGTTFYGYDFKKKHTVVPEAGKGAIFFKDQNHAGDRVKSPYKYLLRTDIMVL